MKKIIVGIIVLASFNMNVTAQSGDNGSRSEAQDRKDRISPRLLEQLDLSLEQKEQIKGINAEYRNQMQEMIKSPISADERRTKREKFEADRKARILAVLTADQRTRLLEMQSQTPGGTNGDFKHKVKTPEGKTKVKVKTDND
jgi:hypothetical protein